jgi:hypothetical protein
MAKEKIVRCTVSKKLNGRVERSTRYVPLEVFGLWKDLMTRRHKFEVDVDCASLWFDIDGDPHVDYPEANYEKVVRLSLWIYSDPDGMFHKITRYFPLDSYKHIRARFLSHYADCSKDSRFPARIEETHGVWLKRFET